MTNPTDVPRSPSNPPSASAPQDCRVRRRLLSGTYSEEFDHLVNQWFDWHYYPINHKEYTEIFPDLRKAQDYIQEQKKSWPNFEYEILNLDK